MRTAAKRDENEAEIVKGLRAQGYFVTHLSGKDVPDLLVIDPNPAADVYVVHTLKDALDSIKDYGMALMEVKMPGTKLKPGQQEWHNKALNKLPDGES